MKGSDFTNLYSFSHQRICRPLVQLARLDCQIQDRCHIVPIHEVQEPDHFFAGIRTDEVASVIEFPIAFGVSSEVSP